MATEPAEFVKTPEEIFLLASRSEQVIESSKLLEYAIREYSGDYRSNFTELYNGNRKIFDKDLRDRIRSAFEIRTKVRNVAKYGEPDFDAKTVASNTFVEAAQCMFREFESIYPNRFHPSEKTSEPDAGFFEQGFESAPAPESEPGSFQAKRDRVTQLETEAEQERRDPSESRPASDVAISKTTDDDFEIPNYRLDGPGGLFPPKFKLQKLEQICNRLGRSIKAGIPLVRAWESESQSLTGQQREAFDEVLNEIVQGATLASSVVKHECFPPMFCEMVRVGEETGRLDQVFLRLSDHYRNLIKMRRTFISGISWPFLQFCAAIGVISLFFVVLAVLETVVATFKAPDIFMLGLGPLGNLMLFWILLTVGITVLTVVMKGVANGWFGELPMKLALRIPLVGRTLQIISLSRFSWSFGMAIESGMDAQRAIRLGVRSTDNFFYTQHEQEIVDSVSQGNDFYTSLSRTDAFPEDFLQAVEVGELTGEITESLERLSDDYREQAELLLKRISQIGGFLVSLFVMGMIILLIVLMYMNYIGYVNDAISNPMGSLEQYESGEMSKKTSNPIEATKNQMVNQIMQSKDMQNITNMYKAMGRADELNGNELLDALLEPFEEKK